KTRSTIRSTRSTSTSKRRGRRPSPNQTKGAIMMVPVKIKWDEWQVMIRRDVCMVNDDKRYTFKKGELYDILGQVPGVGYQINVDGDGVVIPDLYIYEPIKKPGA